MDTTAVGIAVGLVGAVLYVAIRALRSRSFELVPTVLVFLASFSIPGGTVLIRAALSGNLQHLPSSWREHVAVAGIVVMGLAMQFVLRSFQRAWREIATEAAKEVDPA